MKVSKLLVKYFGLVPNENDVFSPRSSFLSDGLFRFTQPIYLNDQGSESKLYPYYNEYSPADLEWAKQQFIKDGGSIKSEKDEKFIKDLYLSRAPYDRYGDIFPHLVQSQLGFTTLDDFDKEQLQIKVNRLNKAIIESISAKLGVFSFCKSVVNELMWTHYASEGRGVAIAFNQNHEFFNKALISDISYKEFDRASITYYKGTWRLNGLPIKDWQSIDKRSNCEEIIQKLLFSKHSKWGYENETRIVSLLEDCDKKLGNTIEYLDNLSGKKISYHEINLKKIPFDAFDSLVFGKNINPVHKSAITNQVVSNPLLSHLKLKTVEYDVFGDLKVIDI